MDIYVIDIRVAKFLPEELLKEFDYKKYNNYDKNVIHCLSYLMVNRILREIYHIGDCEIVFHLNKPILKSGRKHFSISHSGGYIAIGFSDYNCGIDIEEIKERNYRAISEKMGFKSDSLEEFYKNWTEYEAMYKFNESNENISKYYSELGSYILTAVCANTDEKFELYKSF